MSPTEACLLMSPLALDTLLTQGSSKRTKANKLMLTLSAIFFAIAHFLSSWMGSSSPFIAALALFMSFCIGMSILYEPNFGKKLVLIFLSWAILLAYAIAIDPNHDDTVLASAFAVAGYLFSMGRHLVFTLERKWNASLQIGKSIGFAEKDPTLSGLILTIVMLLGCVPGSMLFWVEDHIMDRAVTYSTWAILPVALITLVLSIVGFQAYVSIFYGTSSEPHISEAHIRSDTGDKNLILYRLLLFIIITSGLVASIFF